MARGGKARQVLFRIFYSTSFTLVFLVLVIFTAVTPSDSIYESYKRNRLIDIFLVAGVYVFTALAAILFYASRIYTNRSVLRDIPKTFMPVEKEDLPGKRVHRLIEECLERTAVIAYQARPRAHRLEHETPSAGARMHTLTKTRTSTDDTIEPSWGKVAHPGWSSPANKELPGLEYVTVVDELVDLVEAKAVALIPGDPMMTPAEDGMSMPDPRVIEAIARSASMGMRAYLRYLIEVGVVPDNSLSVAFLAAYERARYSSMPLSSDNFGALMRMFAELLRSMAPVDVDMLDLDEVEDDDSGYTSDVSEHDERPELPERRSQHQVSRLDPDTASLASTYSASGSVQHHKSGPPRRISEDSAPSLTSEEREESVHDDDGLYSTGDVTHNEEQDAPQTPQRPMPPPRPMTSETQSTALHSSESLSLRSEPKSETGSVIRHGQSINSRHSSQSSRFRRGGLGIVRLASEDEMREGGLPYRIDIPGSQG